MNFATAIAAALTERRICRLGWPRNTFVVMMPELRLPPFNTQGTERRVNDRTAKWIGPDTPLNCRPYLAIYYSETNEWQPGWLPTTRDIFATDWEILPND